MSSIEETIKSQALRYQKNGKEQLTMAGQDRRWDNWLSTVDRPGSSSAPRTEPNLPDHFLDSSCYLFRSRRPRLRLKAKRELLWTISFSYPFTRLQPELVICV